MSHIWLPPPSESVAPQVSLPHIGKQIAAQWAPWPARAETWTYASQGYLPGQLYNLNSKFGNKEELKALVAACKEAGVRPVCECACWTCLRRLVCSGALKLRMTGFVRRVLVTLGGAPVA